MAKMDDMIKVIQTIPMDYRMDLFDRAIRLAAGAPKNLIHVSWDEYKRINTQWEEEEYYRTKIYTPSILSELNVAAGTDAGGIDDHAAYLNGEGVRDAWQIVDSTADYRNEVMMKRKPAKLMPMDRLMDEAPNMIKSNISKVQSAMFGKGDSKGGYYDAPAGEGKSTLFATFMPRMSAELALNFKDLWYQQVEIQRGVRGDIENPTLIFTEETKNTWRINPLRFYNMDASDLGEGSAFQGEANKVPKSLSKLILDNPGAIALCVDEVYSQFTKQGDSTADAFVQFIKKSMGGGGGAKSKDLPYKFWGMYATNDKENFERHGQDSYLNSQMRRRLAEVSADIISWTEIKNRAGQRTDRDPIKWLDKALNGMLAFAKRTIPGQNSRSKFRGDVDINKASQDIREHIINRRPALIRAIFDKADKVFEDFNSEGHSLAVPSAFNKTVSAAISGPYQQRLIDPKYLQFRQAEEALLKYEETVEELAAAISQITREIEGIVQSLGSQPKDKQEPEQGQAPAVSPDAPISARDTFSIPEDMFAQFPDHLQQQMRQVNEVNQRNEDIISTSRDQRLIQKKQKRDDIMAGMDEMIMSRLNALEIKSNLEAEIREDYEEPGDSFAVDLMDYNQLIVYDIKKTSDSAIRIESAGEYSDEDDEEQIEEESVAPEVPSGTTRS
jgi:hypothetical protein